MMMRNLFRKYAYAVIIYAATAIFVVIGTLFAAQMHVVYMTTGGSPDSLNPAPTPADAVKRLFENVQRRCSLRTANKAQPCCKEQL